MHDRETRRAALDAIIARGIADADRGLTVAAADIFDRLERKYRKLDDIVTKCSSSRT